MPISSNNRPETDSISLSALNSHKSSSDHDDRYYAKSEVDTKLSEKQPLGSYLTSETDPIFAASQAHNITSTHISVLNNISGTNTGDETNATIISKLGTDLSNKALDSSVVHKTGVESIAGAKTFTDVSSFSCPSYPVTSHQRTASSGSTEVAVGRYVAQTNNSIVSGFGCHYDYCIADSANNVNQLARIGAKRDGVNNGYGTLYLTTTNNYTVAEKFNILASGHLIPYIDNTYNLGDATHRMGVIYAGTGTINTSDERQKEQITSLLYDPRMSLFFDLLRPVSYKFKNYVDKSKVTELHPGENGEQVEVEKEVDNIHKFKRLHHGLIAQEVEQAMSDCNITSNEFAGLIKDSESDYYGLRYEEFIPMLIQQVQNLKKEVGRLKSGN